MGISGIIIAMEETSANVNETYTHPITGKFIPGNPGGGRPKDTLEQKLIRKASKEIIADYKEALAEALPFIQPVLIARALDGDLVAIKEIHDRTMDKAKQATDTNVTGTLTVEISKEIADKHGITSSTEANS